MPTLVSIGTELRPTVLWIPLLLAVLVACDDPIAEVGGGASAPVRSDGVEVPVVRSEGSVLERPSGWGVSPRPDLLIGETNERPGFLFSRISGVQVLTTGEIVVVDQGANEIHWFSPNGDHVGSTGRPGEGPGEVIRPTLVRSPIDGLTGIYDSGLYRVTWFDHDGSVSLIRSMETVSLPPPPRGPFLGTPDFGLFRHLVPPCSRDGPCEMEVPYAWVSLISGKTDTLVVARPRLHITTLPDGSPFSIAVPFVASPAFALGDEILLLTEGKDYEVRAYDFSGEPVRVMRVDRGAPPVTSEAIERYLEGLGNVLLSEDEMRRLARNFDFPTQLPAFTDLKATPSGRIFARLRPWTEWEQPRWLVFGADGVAVGYIETPKGLSVADFGNDHVIGVETDNFGRQTVVRYPVVHDEFDS